jgi:hypothetical protein
MEASATGRGRGSDGDGDGWADTGAAGRGGRGGGCTGKAEGSSAACRILEDIFCRASLRCCLLSCLQDEDGALLSAAAGPGSSTSTEQGRGGVSEGAHPSERYSGNGLPTVVRPQPDGKSTCAGMRIACNAAGPIDGIQNIFLQESHRESTISSPHYVCTVCMRHVAPDFAAGVQREGVQ